LKLKTNCLRQMRESLMLSKSELARNAGLAALTVSRIEKGGECRLETKGKILAALGLSPSQRGRVFPEG
jgi:DNA-binding XRE family transcriptional regulator